MNRILKFALREGRGSNVIEMPRGSTIVHVGLDGKNLPAVWAECPNTSSTNNRTFIVLLFTGDEVPAEHNHLATFMDAGLVFHAYIYEPIR